MPWVESVSASFTARHALEDGDDADRILHSLERTRDRLDEHFSRVRGDLTVVVHRSAVSLSMARPLTPVAWALSAPAARRYVAGWAGGGELHVLGAAALDARASAVPGSREMLSLTAAALYARLVVQESNADLPRRLRPARLAVELRWAWLFEGAARWFAGQTEHARPAIARRLREGGRPSFPPSPRDAPLLGGTVIDLLVREEGERAAAALASRLHPQGPRTALSQAFPGRSLGHTETAWRSHLARLTGEREDQPDQHRPHRQRRQQPDQ
jgi:hypothetical protein